jgi:hypothetical protein
MQLPNSWIDRIFARLLVRYGSAWLRLWESLDIEVVKADWAVVLGSMPTDSLLYGLENLPDDRPPATAQAFRAICLRRPDRPLPALTHSYGKARPEVIAKLRQAAEAMRAGRGSREWAGDRRDGDTEAQRSMRRAGAREPAMDHAALGPFKPPSVDCLPPGMRGGAA